MFRGIFRTSMLAVTVVLGICLGRGLADEAARPPKLHLKGGTLYDGSGQRPFVGDLLLEGGRIVAVGTAEQPLASPEAERTIDCEGLIVTPGFIDLHNHSDFPILQAATRDGRNYLTQGCTTLVTGNCGGGQVDVRKYLQQLDEHGIGVNVVHLVPAGAVRNQVLGAINRPPADEELRQMQRLVEEGMQAGAFGMSTGLIYVPGAYADTAEIASLAAIAGKHGGIYASHIRGEGKTLLDAVTEAIEIGKQGKLPVHISHFKASGRDYWGGVRPASQLIEKAREAGQTVTADQYPYTASSTSLAAMVLSSAAREGSSKDLANRLNDEQKLPKLRQEIASSLADRVRILVASYKPRPEWSGKSIADIAATEQREPVDVVVEILRNGGAAAVSFSMNEEDVRFVMQQPWVATASDGSVKVDDGSKPHPRSYGTFTRKLGRYCLQEKVLPLEQALRSCNGLPADILGLQDRGYLRPGQAADVVVLDPKTLMDNATFEEPFLHSSGVQYAVVNGQLAVDGGKPTKALGGKALRKK